MAASTEMSRSTDGGITFQAHSVPGAGNINGIQCAGNDFWYIRGTKIFHSTDDGINWIEEYDTPSGLSLNHLDFPDSLNECQIGWAVGYGGTIHKMTGSTVTSVNDQSETPGMYVLEQNYPNPFNPNTVISYRLPVTGKVILKVYDMIGNEVATLVNEEKQAGNYKA